MEKIETTELRKRIQYIVKRKAKELKLPSKRIIKPHIVKKISILHPKTKQELLAIRKFGDLTFERIGKELLYVLNKDYSKVKPAIERKVIEISEPNYDYEENLITFHNKIKLFPDDYLKNFTKQREVIRNSNNISGKVFLENIKKEVDFESKKGELFFLKRLDNKKLIKDVVVQSVKLQYTLKGIIKNYYPDFLVLDNQNRVYICEIKPQVAMSWYENTLKYNALIKYAKENGYGYAMIGYNRNYRSINQIKNRNYNKNLEKIILKYIKSKGEFNRINLQQYKIKNKVSRLDLTTIVLRNNLKHFEKNHNFIKITF